LLPLFVYIGRRNPSEMLLHQIIPLTTPLTWLSWVECLYRACIST